VKSTLKYVPYAQYVIEDWANSLQPPERFTIKLESNELIFNSPDAAYVVSAHYFSKAQILVNNTDIPLMPRQYSTAIYYQAAADIALKLGFIEIYQLLSTKAAVAIGSLLRSQNPSKKVHTRGIC